MNLFEYYLQYNIIKYKMKSCLEECINKKIDNLDNHNNHN